MSNGPEWFSAKRYGYGTAFPIAWQGWAVTAIYALVVIAGAYFFPKRPVILLSIILPATILYLVIAARTTKGGMRWRRGGDPN
ncbi:hypothetical protein LZ496_07995 [Sphingomonas sp. NSE70-1]|uniref:Uncharacterized protein n=1 Tax=Sphingomonas caseinilyticus TaxID=2908205 RepID=A0ABT0RUK8_9SPHN|nr:hypothetical protein [Sphingomonas caseinilyticus]MCL6698719.1 hypothetical protein [Sphingomonas caseinilyticus]